MSSELARVLDVQRRRLDELEAALDAVEAGRAPELPSVPTTAGAVVDYDALVTDADAWRCANRMHDVLPAVASSTDRRPWA